MTNYNTPSERDTWRKIAKELKNDANIPLVDLNFDGINENEPYLFIINGTRSRTHRLPKKLKTEWIQNKISKFINSKSQYINLIKTFKKLDIKGGIYYTSFGFSFCTFMKSKERFEQDNNRIKAHLNDLGIEYSNEFSDACWVYRYRISQRKENIDRINLINN